MFPAAQSSHTDAAMALCVVSLLVCLRAVWRSGHEHQGYSFKQEAQGEAQGLVESESSGRIVPHYNGFGSAGGYCGDHYMCWWVALCIKAWHLFDSSSRVLCHGWMKLPWAVLLPWAHLSFRTQRFESLLFSQTLF